jgi:hypothetical protein
VKWICPFLKTISQLFNQSQNLEYIAETCNSALRTGVDDITGFLSLYFLPISWRYVRFHTRSHHPNILYRQQLEKACTFYVGLLFLVVSSI